MALVVFLRGVNVGGHKTFRPTRLVEELKHLDVVNIGAAGTFVVRRAAGQAEVRGAFARRLPFEADIMICQGRDVLRLMSQTCFADEPQRPDIVRFVTVLSRTPRTAPSIPLSLPPNGEWLLKVLAREGRFVFGVYRRQMKAIRYLSALERLFDASATTRNWNTIAEVVQVLNASRTRR